MPTAFSFIMVVSQKDNFTPKPHFMQVGSQVGVGMNGNSSVILHSTQPIKYRCRGTIFCARINHLKIINEMIMVCRKLGFKILNPYNM